MKNERTIFSSAMMATTLATPKITGALIKASHSSKPYRQRVDDLDLAISLTADVLDKLTLARTQLGWNRREETFSEAGE